MIELNQNIAVAESVTGGLLQYALSGVIDAASFYEGGIPAYNISHKCIILGVDPRSAIAYNCVSREIAETMALNSKRLFNSDWAMAITGYATRVPESQNKLFAFYAICYGQKIIKSGKLVPANTSPGEVQASYANELLHIFLTILQAQNFKQGAHSILLKKINE